MLTCPNCGNDAMSAWKKIMLGPGRTTQCNACGAKLSVSWLTIIAVPIVVLVAILGEMLGGYGVIAMLLSIIPVSYVWYRYVPLVLRGSPATKPLP